MSELPIKLVPGVRLVKVVVLVSWLYSVTAPDRRANQAVVSGKGPAVSPGSISTATPPQLPAALLSYI